MMNNTYAILNNSVCLMHLCDWYVPYEYKVEFYVDDPVQAGLKFLCTSITQMIL